MAMRLSRRSTTASSVSVGGVDSLSDEQAKKISDRVEAQMASISLVARAASVSALTRANEDWQRGILRHERSAPTLKDERTNPFKVKDRHMLRERSGANLWAKQKSTTMIFSRSSTALQRPHSGLHRKAQKVWLDGVPEPIQVAASRFDRRLSVSKRRAHLAMKSLREDPTSQQHMLQFGNMVKELSRERYSLVAPVEHLAEAYPDGVWGISLDQLGSRSRGYERPRSATAGMAFHSRPESNRVPVRPTLPESPGLKRNDHVHMILPDSHHALGAFPAFPEKDEYVWRRKANVPHGSQTPQSPVNNAKKSRKKLKRERIGAPRPGGTGGGWELLQWQETQVETGDETKVEGLKSVNAGRVTSGRNGSSAAPGNDGVKRSVAEGVRSALLNQTNAPKSSVENVATSGDVSRPSTAIGGSSDAFATSSSTHQSHRESSADVHDGSTPLGTQGGGTWNDANTTSQSQASAAHVQGCSDDGTNNEDGSFRAMPESMPGTSARGVPGSQSGGLPDDATNGPYGGTIDPVTSGETCNYSQDVGNTHDTGVAIRRQGTSFADGHHGAHRGRGQEGALNADSATDRIGGSAHGTRAGCDVSPGSLNAANSAAVPSASMVDEAGNGGLSTGSAATRRDNGGPALACRGSSGPFNLAAGGAEQIGSSSGPDAKLKGSFENTEDAGRMVDVPRRFSRGTPLVGDALDMSIWRSRKFGPKYRSDSHAFIDTQRCVKKAFLSDWNYTSAGMVMSSATRTGRAFGRLNLSQEILEQLQDTLYEFYPMLLRVFLYYSCVGAEASGIVYGIGKAGYTLLLNDARLDLMDARSSTYLGNGQRMPRHAKKRGEDGFDLLWTAVNSSALSKSQSKTNSKDRMTRSEFMEWVVRAATDEVQVAAMTQNVRWFCEDLCHNLSVLETASVIFNNANWFRLDACYTVEVEAALQKHAFTLRNIFQVYATGKGVGTDAAERNDLMSYDEWAMLWNELGFTRELTERKIGAIFAQSRMTVIEEHSKSGSSVQLERLPFEGFLEAFTRIADIKTLPTDAELEAKGHRYPGEYLRALRSEGMDCYRGWAAETRKLHDAGMGDPIWSRVECLVMIIVYIMQCGVEASPGGPELLLRGTADETLTAREVNIYHVRPQPNLLGSTEAEDGNMTSSAMEQVANERAAKRFFTNSAQHEEEEVETDNVENEDAELLRALAGGEDGI